MSGLLPIILGWVVGGAFVAVYSAIRIRRFRRNCPVPSCSICRRGKRAGRRRKDRS